MNKENILYYQSNIKTSRDEDSVYAMKYANQQMLIDKLEQQCKKQKEVIDKINNYIDNYDIFKVFSFPLMKRWEEEQVKSSIDYEFKTSLIKDLKEILEDKEVSE